LVAKTRVAGGVTWGTLTGGSLLSTRG
jgi:hypothetical protein